MFFAGPVLRLLPWLVFGQGLLLSLAVFSKRKYGGNGYLSIFLFMLSIHGLVALAWQNPGQNIIPELTVLITCLPYLYGPLIYRYIWQSLFRNWPDPVPFVIHALPALANLLIYGLVYLIGGRDHFASVVADVFSGQAPNYVIAIEWGKIISGLSYIALIIRLIYRNKDGVKRWAAREQRSRWLRSLITAFSLCWFLVLVSAILMWGRRFPENLGIIITGIQLISFLAFLYMVTFFALRYPAILEPRDVREEIRRKLNLPEGFVEETLRRLEKSRRARFYADPEITLPVLAQKLGLHANALSYIVNEETDSGFREYLNNLRLEDFLRQAESNDGSKTQLDMAYEAGFSSKTTFLRAFRGRYNSTPAEFLSKQGAGSHTSGTTTHTGTPGQ